MNFQWLPTPCLLAMYYPELTDCLVAETQHHLSLPNKWPKLLDNILNQLKQCHNYHMWNSTRHGLELNSALGFALCLISFSRIHFSCYFFRIALAAVPVLLTSTGLSVKHTIQFSVVGHEYCFVLLLARLLPPLWSTVLSSKSKWWRTLLFYNILGLLLFAVTLIAQFRDSGIIGGSLGLY